MTTLPHRRELPAATRLKLAASLILAAPAAALLALAVGEMLGGDPSGAQHIAQAAPLLLLLAAGWRYPRAAGVVLLCLAPILLAAWLVFVVTRGESAPRGLEILGWVATGLVVFVPPVAAGWLLLKASRLSATTG
jgi:hypothetical protein